MILTMFFPGYIEPLLTHPLGTLMLIISGVMQVLGFIIMRRIIDIRV